MSHFECLRKLELPQGLLVDRGFRHPPHPQIDLKLILPGAIGVLGISFPDGMVLSWLHKLHDQLKNFPRFKRLYLLCLPQHGRFATWFANRKPAIIEQLQSAQISVKIMDVGKSSWQPRKSRTKSVDIFENCDKCVVDTCVCIQNLFGDLESGAERNECGIGELPMIID